MQSCRIEFIFFLKKGRQRVFETLRFVNKFVQKKNEFLNFHIIICCDFCNTISDADSVTCLPTFRAYDLGREVLLKVRLL